MTPERSAQTEIIQINKLAQTKGGAGGWVVGGGRGHPSRAVMDLIRFLLEVAALPSPICIIAHCAILIPEFTAYWKCKV